jgi:hypothetical protein
MEVSGEAAMGILLHALLGESQDGDEVEVSLPCALAKEEVSQLSGLQEETVSVEVAMAPFYEEILRIQNKMDSVNKASLQLSVDQKSPYKSKESV